MGSWGRKENHEGGEKVTPGPCLCSRAVGLRAPSGARPPSLCLVRRDFPPVRSPIPVVPRVCDPPRPVWRVPRPWWSLKRPCWAAPRPRRPRLPRRPPCWAAGTHGPSSVVSDPQVSVFVRSSACVWWVERFKPLIQIAFLKAQPFPLSRHGF